MHTSLCICIPVDVFLILVFFLGNVDEEPTSVTGRKDSLSINLEFVKVSLSRIRRSGGASFFESQSVSKSASKMDTTLINISGILFYSS